MINIIISDQTNKYKTFVNNLAMNPNIFTGFCWFPESDKTHSELKLWLSDFLKDYNNSNKLNIKKDYYIMTRSQYLLHLITIANKAYLIQSSLNEEGLVKLNETCGNLIVSGSEISLIEVLNEKKYNVIPHYNNMLNDDNLLNIEIRNTNNVFRKLLTFANIYNKDYKPIEF